MRIFGLGIKTTFATNTFEQRFAYLFETDNEENTLN